MARQLSSTRLLCGILSGKVGDARRRDRGGLDLNAMPSVKAHVHNGRLVLDEPTDLPEGRVDRAGAAQRGVARGGDNLDDKERAPLHRSIEEGIEDFERGDTEDAFEFLARLKARREDRDRQASEPSGRTSK
jgi:hypothetical protein